VVKCLCPFSPCIFGVLKVTPATGVLGCPYLAATNVASSTVSETLDRENVTDCEVTFESFVRDLWRREEKRREEKRLEEKGREEKREANRNEE